MEGAGHPRFAGSPGPARSGSVYEKVQLAHDGGEHGLQLGLGSVRCRPQSVQRRRLGLDSGLEDDGHTFQDRLDGLEQL